MIVGFTGTQVGTTVKQQGELLRWMGLFGRSMIGGEQRVFRHGGCVGADEQAHHLAWALHWDIEGYPASGVDQQKMAKFDGSQFSMLFKPKHPLDRNHDIVDGTGTPVLIDRHTTGAIDVLLVCPRERTEVQRSGTWTTFRYARSKGIPTLIIWP